MPKLQWRASERSLVTPFPTSDLSLAGVRFRLHRGVEPSTEPIHHLDDTPLDKGTFCPELFLSIDTNQIMADTHFAVKDIRLSVLVRDRVLNWFETLNSWDLDSLPEDGWNMTTSLSRISSTSRLDIAVVATPLGPVVNGQSVPIPEGAILAKKVFFLRPRPQILDDLVRTVDPAQMETEGLPRATVWYVKWKGEDVNAAPTDLLEIWLNKDFEDKFEQLSAKGANTAARHIACAIAAQVYGEILAQVLITDEECGEPGSLVCMVERLIEQKLQLSLPDARRLYGRGPEGRARIASQCWRLVGADRSFARLQF